MNYNELVDKLRENAEWAEANEWEVPLTLPDNLKDAAQVIEELQQHAEYYRRQADILRDAIGEGK